MNFDTPSLALVAAVVMAVIAVAKRYPLKTIDPKWIPMITVALSIVSSVATALASGHAIVPALGTGISVGLAAIGCHETQDKIRQLVGKSDQQAVNELNQELKK